jgi:hypothetical protein
VSPDHLPVHGDPARLRPTIENTGLQCAARSGFGQPAQGSPRRLTRAKGSAPRVEVSGVRIDPHPVLGCDACLSGLLQTISLELPRRPLPAGEFVCATAGGADNQQKSLAGTVGGTAGLTTGTVAYFTKENYRPRSDDKDRTASFEHFNGPTTGTHIHLPDGGRGPVTQESARMQAASANLMEVAVPRDRQRATLESGPKLSQGAAALHCRRIELGKACSTLWLGTSLWLGPPGAPQRTCSTRFNS